MRGAVACLDYSCRGGARGPHLRSEDPPGRQGEYYPGAGVGCWSRQEIGAGSIRLKGDRVEREAGGLIVLVPELCGLSPGSCTWSQILRRISY